MIIRNFFHAIGVLLVLDCTAALGAFVTYDFTGQPGDQVSTPVTTSVINVTADPIVRGSGLNASAAANSMSSSAFSTGGIDLTDYYGFTLTASAGFNLDVNSIAFSERRSATGILSIVVRSSLDGFTGNLFSTSVPDDTLTRRQTVTLGSAFDSISGPIEFRIYGFGAEAAGGTWRLGAAGSPDNPNGFASNLQVDVTANASGEATATPAPPSAIMAGSAMLIGIFTMWRRRRTAIAPS